MITTASSDGRCIARLAHADHQCIREAGHSDGPVYLGHDYGDDW